MPVTSRRRVIQRLAIWATIGTGIFLRGTVLVGQEPVREGSRAAPVDHGWDRPLLVPTESDWFTEYKRARYWPLPKGWFPNASPPRVHPKLDKPQPIERPHPSLTKPLA